MIQGRDTGDESEAAMTDERAAVELEKKFPWIVAGFHMNPRSSVAVLKRYDDSGNLLEERDIDVAALEARVSELTRLLAEAEEAIREARSGWSAFELMNIWLEDPAVQRALQSREGGKSR